MSATLAVLLALLPLALPDAQRDARAQSSGGENCLETDPPPIDAPPNRIRFGTTPLAAGSAGTSQLEPVPNDPAKDVAGAEALRPDRRQLIMRMNRMFMADGVEGIERYVRIVDRYARAGFESELQVRYHPSEEDEGDMAAWGAYVRDAARILGSRPAVSGLSITNEANFSVSPNTSDGSYEGVREAIVTGMVAARDELDRIGREDVELGFSFAWRWTPESDREFWEEIGRLATPKFRRALDYVGLQVYPHLVWPPAPIPGRSAGDEIAEALTLLRHCYMPKAGLGEEVDVWVTENGYATNLGRSEASQAKSLRSTVEAVHAYSGTLGVTDYRYFNLRDNRTGGQDFFDSVGLMRDDYSRKPAYDTLRDLVGEVGTNRSRENRCRGRLATVLAAAGGVTRGTRGADVIVGSGGDDVIAAGAGDDLVCSGRGADVVRGGSGDDPLVGNRGRDVLRGGAGDDTLGGGRGADRLDGKSGRDRCRGGRGSDVKRRCER